MCSVYCLHGLMGTSLAHCGFQIKAWQRTRPVVAFDLPGHGRSRAAAIRPYFDTSLELLRRRMLRSGPGHVFGVSYLGGTLAVRAALSFPELIRSLVLTGYAPDVPEVVFNGWVDGFRKLAAANASLAQQYDGMHGDHWSSTLDIIAEECNERYASAISITRSMIAKLRVPTLIVNGGLKSDERVAAAELPSCNPLVEGAIIPAAGHIAGHDQPEIFNLIVEKFWERING